MYIWLVPVIVVASVILSHVLGPDAFYFWMTSPTSVMEVTTGITLLIALAVGLSTLCLPSVRRNGVLLAWLCAFCLGVFFFVGEDQNWGQYYLNLDVPQYFLDKNKENEINLHNISSWFNQKPRAMVELWVIVVGILVPLGWEWPRKVTARFVPSVFWIGRTLLAAAVIGILLGWSDRLSKMIGYDIATETGIRFSELQEFCYAWFMLLYIRIVREKLKSATIEQALA